MKFFKYIFLFGIIVFSSCGEKQDASPNNTERDSLLAIIDEQKRDLMNTDYAMSEMASVLDSIAKYENMLISNPEGHLSKANAINNLKRFKEILDVYKKRLVAMQDSLSNSKGVNKSLLTIIDQMKGQLESKENQIIALTQEVQSGKREIKSLKTSISALNRTNTELTADNNTLTRIADTQDKMINRGYFIVDTKDNLKKMGILDGGGLFRKSKVNSSNIDASHFISIDIRVTSEITVQGKSPKILSQMPSGSYHWAGSKLVIDDPTSFWKVTNYLIIQVK